MCKLLSILAIILAVTCFQANGQVWRDGPCRTLPVVEGFEQSQFLGLWYENSRYDYEYQAGGDCARAQYTAITGQTEYINVNNSMLFTGNNTWHTRLGFGHIQTPAVGFIGVYFNVSLPEGEVAPPESTLQIIQTDYVTHAIMWSCRMARNSTIQSEEYLWVLTREREPTAQTNFAVTQFVRLLFQPASLRATVQSSDRCGAAQIYAGILLALIMSAIVQFIK